MKMKRSLGLGVGAAVMGLLLGASAGQAGDASNLIENPDFSNGLAPWKVEHGVSRVMADPQQNGVHLLHVTGASWAAVTADITEAIKPGASYVVMAQGRISDEKVKANLGVQFIDAQGKVLGDPANAAVTTTQLAPYSVFFTVPAEARQARLVIREAGKGDTEFADFEHFVLTAAPAASGGASVKAANNITTATSAAPAPAQAASVAKNTYIAGVDTGPVVSTTHWTESVGNANRGCGGHASGAAYTIVTGTTSGTTTASVSQCPYGGTQPTLTIVSQNYSCSNGALSPVGDPFSVTYNTGNPSCNQVVGANGVCGSAIAIPATMAPTTNLCSVGVASSVSGIGPWNWTCTGINGGTTASCSTAAVTLSNVTLSSPIVYPTNTLVITSNLVTGAAPVSNVPIETIIQDTSGNIIQDTTLSWDVAANTTRPITYSYTVPENTVLTPGTYQILQGPPGANGISVIGTAQFTVPAATTTLNEEFDDGRTALNMNIWQPMLYWSAIENQESGAYVPDEVSIVPNVGLQLRSDIRQWGTQPYTTGGIASFNGFLQTYGHFEMKAQLPAGAGLWPAFWLFPLNPGSPTGEIDIFEYLGYEPTIIHQTLHDTGGESLNCYGPNWSLAPHVYAVDWTPTTSMVFSIDGVPCNTQTNITSPSVPMYIIANDSIGSASDWAGATNASTPFPSIMNINYIKAWQYPGLSIITPPAQIGNITMTPAHPNPGDTVTISGTVTAGATALSAATLPQPGETWTNHGFGWNFYGAPGLIQGSFSMNAIAANSAGAFSYTMTIPSSWPANAYRSGLTYVTNDGVEATFLTEFVIGNPFPPLP